MEKKKNLPFRFWPEGPLSSLLTRQPVRLLPSPSSRWRLGPTSLFHRQVGQPSHPLHRVSRTRPGASPPNRSPGKPRIRFLFRQPRSYKVFSPTPQFPFASKPRIKAQAALNLAFWIPPWPRIFSTTARVLCSFSGQTDPLGELATSLSTGLCSRFNFWCTKVRERTTPASFAAPAMAPPRRVSPPAVGRRPTLPWRAGSR